MTSFDCFCSQYIVIKCDSATLLCCNCSINIVSSCAPAAPNFAYTQQATCLDHTNTDETIVRCCLVCAYPSCLPNCPYKYTYMHMHTRVLLLVLSEPKPQPHSADAGVQTVDIGTLCPMLAAGLVGWLASLCLAVCPLAETNPVEQSHPCRCGSGRDWCVR